jgi:four helix bundle protein
MRITTELRKRSKNFGSMVIHIYIELPKTREEVRILGRQMLRSGTSVAAHVREASRARSDSEFCSKLDQLLQEADECQLWIEYLREDCQLDSPSIKSAHQESDELISIFTTIVQKVRTNMKS